MRQITSGLLLGLLGCGSTVQVEAPGPEGAQEQTAPACAEVELSWLTDYDNSSHEPFVAVEGEGFYRIAGPHSDEPVLERWTTAGVREEVLALEERVDAIYVQPDGLHVGRSTDDGLTFGPVGGAHVTVDAGGADIRLLTGADQGDVFAGVRMNDERWDFAVFDAGGVRWSQPFETGDYRLWRVHPRLGRLPLVSAMNEEGQLFAGEAGETLAALPVPACEEIHVPGRYELTPLRDGALAWAFYCRDDYRWVTALRDEEGTVLTHRAPENLAGLALFEGPDETVIEVWVGHDGGATFRVLDGRTAEERSRGSLVDVPVEAPGQDPPSYDFPLFRVVPPRVTVDGAFVFEAHFEIPDGMLARVGVGSVHCP